MNKASKDEVADTFVCLVLAAELDTDEIERLRDIAHNRSGAGKRALDAKLKRARREHAERQAQENRQPRIAERRDPRPQIPAPANDAPWLPQMQVLNDVLGKSCEPEPPMRGAEGFVLQVRVRRVPKMHLLTASSGMGQPAARRGDILPSIEKALTTETYSDRILGESGTASVPAFTVQTFTGNNVMPRGDLASRSLPLRLAVDRPDPENRLFLHPEPIAWTEANRGRILQALYTILLGNPRLLAYNSEQAPTRFKPWWHLVGSAVEHAAAQHARIAEEEEHWFAADPHPSCPPAPIKFAELFLTGEAEDGQSVGLAIVLDVLRRRWPNGFKSADVASYAGDAEEGAVAFKAALEQATGKLLKVISSPKIAWLLKCLVDAPVTSRGMLSIGSGITVRAQDNMSLYAQYDAVTHTGNTTDETIAAGLRIRF